MNQVRAAKQGSRCGGSLEVIPAIPQLSGEDGSQEEVEVSQWGEGLLPLSNCSNERKFPEGLKSFVKSRPLLLL